VGEQEEEETESCLFIRPRVVHGHEQHVIFVSGGASSCGLGTWIGWAVYDVDGEGPGISAGNLDGGKHFKIRKLSLCTGHVCLFQ
jgi:hypothetical protein